MAEGTGISPAIVGEFVLPDGRRAVPVFQLLAQRYLDSQYAPDAVAERCGVPADTIRRIARELAAAAFDEPRDVLARCIDVMVTETAGVETWIAWDGEAPRSAVTVTPTGSTAGISLMATPPEHQRQGMGRALLTQVMADYRSRGVTRFHLGATPAGRPLYDSLGFEPIAELSAWMLSADGALAGRPRGELS